jgi:hypothetical protein
MFASVLIRRILQTEGVWEKSAEENIWNYVNEKYKGGRREMSNKEHLNLYYWPNISMTLKMNEMGAVIAMHLEKRHADLQSWRKQTTWKI